MAAANGSKTVTFLVIAVVCGVLAALLSGWYLKSKEKAMLARQQQPEEQLVPVITPKQDLPEGLRIRSEYFNVDYLPARYVHPNAIRPQDYKQYDGRFLLEPLPAGKPLLASFLDETFPIDFSDLVAKGRRAMTITVDEVNSIGGHIRPGNFVDIFIIVSAGAVGRGAASVQGALPGELQQVAAERSPSEIVIPVLQHVKVLATGEAAYDETLDELMRPQRTGGRRFTNLTLDVSPQEAALLAAAVDAGDPVALLRNRRDETYAEFTSVSAYDLIAHANRMQRQAALREAAAAAGATINENGDWVMPDGTVVRKEDVIVGADGTVMTRGGKVLAAKGLRMNDNGDFVDAQGNVIPKDELVVRPDGSVTTKAELMAEAGYTVNENGDYVDADGNVIRKEDVQVLANGSVVSRDGKVLAGPKVTRTKDGFLVAADGTVMTADGQVLTGVRVNSNGEVVTADGRVLRDPNLQIAADGTVRDSSGRAVSGVGVGGGVEAARRAAAAPAALAEAEAGVFDRVAAEFLEGEGAAIDVTGPRLIDFIVGGAGKDGVAPVNQVPVR